MEEAAVGRTKSPTREWIFPAFNRLDTGPTNGYHYFVDVSDYQQITNKLLDAGNYIALEDTSSLAGLYNATWDKHLSIAWGGSYPAGGFNSAAGTLTTPTGTQPSLQIPSLDYKVQGAASTRDRSHVWCVMKKAHTAAPFEPNSFLYGGATGKELYAMLATASGTIAAASNGFIPYFNNTLALTVTFSIGSALVTLDAGTTTGMRVGMRVRQTANNYTLPEDVFVQQVNNATQFTMTTTWPGSTVGGQTIQVFGPTWENVSAISGSITDVLDSLFRIVDNGDITKKLAFEASGITTATTRTWTVPDFDGTPALFRSGKLRIGDTAAPTHNLEIIAGTTTVAPIRLTSGTSLTVTAVGALEFTTNDLFFTITTGGRKRLLMADPTAGLTSGRVPFSTTNGRLTDDATFLFGAGTLTASNLTATGNITGFLITAMSQLDVASFMSARGTGLRIGDTSAATYPLEIVASDTAIGAQIDVANITENSFGLGLNFLYTDNNAGVQTGDRIGLSMSLAAAVNAAATTTLGTLAGLQFTNYSQLNNVITITKCSAIDVINAPFVGAGGATSTILGTYGISANVDISGNGATGTEIVGAYLGVGSSAGTVSKMAGVVVDGYNGPFVTAVTSAVAYDITSNFAPHANVTTWYGLRIPSISGPGTIWGIYQSGTMDSAIAGEVKFGATTAPTAWVDIAAGSTARVPLLLASGTLKTTAVAGGIEFLTDDFYATITTGAARKAFILDNGSRLTSGKIPIATTNGRLIDLTASSAYTPTNVTTDRSYDANATTTDELADVLGTLIADLQAKGILG